MKREYIYKKHLLYVTVASIALLSAFYVLFVKEFRYETILFISEDNEKDTILTLNTVGSSKQVQLMHSVVGVENMCESRAQLFINCVGFIE